MPSFLIQINKMGSIEQVIWSDPEQFISDEFGSLFQLFEKNGKSALLRAIKRSSSRDDALFCDEPLWLRGRPNIASVCIVSMKKNFLVFASEDPLPQDNERNQTFQTVILMFMNIVKSFAGKAAAGGGNASGSEQVEMIQTLVGEIRTRKQMLEEANSKLNTINEDLNNRLVKDSLTGLVSRYQYRAEIEYLIGRNPGRLGIFTFIDIDDFKSINDRYGHAAGDRYLVEFSDRLRLIPEDNMVRMRISGDEFGLFVYGLDRCGAPVMEDLWRKIKLHVLSKPIEANGRKLPITVSAGMSVYGKDTSEIYDLIEYADHAMYSAKRKGKNRYCVYSA